MKPVELIVIGAGSRGTTYSSFASLHPEKVKVEGVAEPREFYRNNLINKFNIIPQNVFTDWKEVANKKKFADAVVIATQDNLHTELAIAFSELGYRILLEKPMAPTENECRQIVEAALKSKNIFAVCHVLRYTKFTQTLKQIIDSGEIGKIINIQRLEPVGYWHFVHSFVRGNWRKESESSPILLAKSCHDLDWIYYLIGSKCKSISSFGNLTHFIHKNKPQNSSNRCVDCQVETECPYSAKKIYLNRVKNEETGWPIDVLVEDVNEQNVLQALEIGPYGRCVYDCDNDVPDHQVVNMFFDKDKTASFTMTAFTEATNRRTRIFGTKGEIEGDGSTIKVFNFFTNKKEVINTEISNPGEMETHGGGDYELMKNYITAVAKLE